jgi:hypothetical protein
MELLFHQRIYIAGIELNSQKLMIFSVEKSLQYSLTNEQFNRKKYQVIYTKQLSMRFGIAEPLSSKIYHIKVEFTDEFGEAMKDFFITLHSNGQSLKMVIICLKHIAV